MVDPSILGRAGRFQDHMDFVMEGVDYRKVHDRQRVLQRYAYSWTTFRDYMRKPEVRDGTPRLYRATNDAQLRSPMLA